MEILELITLDLDIWVKALMSESCVVFLDKKSLKKNNKISIFVSLVQ